MKLDQFPDKGECLVVHPDYENLIIQSSEFADFDYVTSRFAPKGKVFIVDCDYLFGGTSASTAAQSFQEHQDARLRTFWMGQDKACWN